MCVREAAFDLFTLSGDTARLTRTIPIQNKPAGPICFSPDGHRLLFAADSESIAVWDAADWIELKKVAVPNDGGYAVSPDGKLLAAAFRGEAVLWNTTDWARLRTLPLAGKAFTAAFAADGRWLAIGCQDNPLQLQLWDITTGGAYSLRSEAGSVWSLGFTHDSRTLAVGSHDGLVKFWNVATRREVMPLQAHITILTGLAFSPDDQTLATICVDGTTRLWRAPGFDETDAIARSVR